MLHISLSPDTENDALLRIGLVIANSSKRTVYNLQVAHLSKHTFTHTSMCGISLPFECVALWCTLTRTAPCFCVGRAGWTLGLATATYALVYVEIWNAIDWPHSVAASPPLHRHTTQNEPRNASSTRLEHNTLAHTNAICARRWLVRCAECGVRSSGDVLRLMFADGGGGGGGDGGDGGGGASAAWKLQLIVWKQCDGVALRLMSLYLPSIACTHYIGPRRSVVHIVVCSVLLPILNICLAV